ncbi:MAG: DUF4129 domain-containing protein, partial [Bacteroidetes bacterium]|nr:DUF4129 domain-containing protein [Fibrella sp.]
RTHDDSSTIRARYPAADQLRTYQNDRNYQYDRDTTPPRSLLGKIWEWINTKLSELLRSSAYQSVGQYVVLALILALVVWLLYKAEVLGFLFPKKALPTLLDYENLTENIHEISFDDRIDEALAGGNYRLAVRLLYLRTLKQLTDRNLIAWQPDKTNRQYAHELASSPLRADFEQLTTQFEFVWYGDFPIDEQRFGELADQFRQFETGEINLTH